MNADYRVVDFLLSALWYLVLVPNELAGIP